MSTTYSGENDRRRRRWSKVYHRSGKRCKISTIITQLPEDLIYEVFLRLPVKSLIRFRCVSKGVCGTIDSPIFIKKRKRSSSLSSDSDYAFIIAKGSSKQLLSLNFSDDMKRANLIKLPDCSSYKSKYILRYCNGVFCFRDTEQKRYVLWNPSNGTSTNIGLPNLSLNTIMSIGYDSVNDDYKIICSDITIYRTVTTLYVYSLRKGSWRSFDGKFPTGYPAQALCPGICVSSALHWLWTERMNTPRFIAVFDFVTESFRSLPLPSNPKLLRMKPIELRDIGGRLCVTFVRPCRLNVDPVVAPRVWVMEKYGVERSWTPLYTGISSIIIPTLSYFPNKERRLLCYNPMLSWWDPQDNSFEKIDVGEPLGYCYDMQFIYIWNLVRLDQKLI